MDLFNRYVRTVRLLLPRAQREDIINELTEEYREQVAEQERARGRPLTDEEHAALIARFGHPLVIAARYRKPRHVIGPIIFPWYWLLLKITLASVIGARIVIVSFRAYQGEPIPPIEDIALNLIGDVLRIVGWLTFLAAMIDLTLTKSGRLERWTPRPQGPPLQEVAQIVRDATEVVHEAVHGRRRE